MGSVLLNMLHSFLDTLLENAEVQALGYGWFIYSPYGHNAPFAHFPLCNQGLKQ